MSLATRGCMGVHFAPTFVCYPGATPILQQLANLQFHGDILGENR
jgi:hypothetical protein